MDALRQRAASVGGSPGLEIRSVERANLGCRGKRVCASVLHVLAMTRCAIGDAVNSVIVVDDFEGVSLGRSGSKGEDEVGSAGGLGSGETALGNINVHGVGPSRVMSSIGWWEGKESVQGVRERIAPEEWSYMDIVASAYSPIVACVAEREEVRKCMELLKKSFGIGQQRGCANANAKRKASVNRGGQRKRGNASGGARSEEREGWKGDKKLGG
ncbi:uncharacterized protein FOMMEDRAFT_163526 [Fomitiporia mediterranea MF3/22]|uniref:Uncharacterized protein n=1 Tax=Fomitiporia mediterranea (strain MF3/22) TaxID=694068 RepID=R7SFC6_FOMME|nr:uncharacterized protein FOMMEDRAFT_163526 [Fomitiporia mediterranea MF3/22]EJC97408.1 hypothetical protein FOMMEDRAFT_163526 [Fomitiporia mediterranea MF3/22]